MSKDPAFLFYSKDFYEGTRMMLPEERACYIDLLMYQHQNEYIPDDCKRLAMYCSGISAEIVKATLQAKFKLCDKGWYNEKLLKVCNDRREFSDKQSVNGVVGQFWKKAKAILAQKEYSKLKEVLYNQSNTQILEIIKDKNIDKAMLQAMLKHLANENVDVIVNEDVNINKDVSTIKKETKKQNLLFKDSEFYELENLKKGLAESKPPYCEANAEYYYNAMENWSESKGEKKVDWLATCKNWILRDFKEGKLIDKNYKVQQHGINGAKTQYTNGATPFDNWSERNGTK